MVVADCRHRITRIQADGAIGYSSQVPRVAASKGLDAATGQRRKNVGRKGRKVGRRRTISKATGVRGLMIAGKCWYDDLSCS